MGSIRCMIQVRSNVGSYCTGMNPDPLKIGCKLVSASTQVDCLNLVDRAERNVWLAIGVEGGGGLEEVVVGGKWSCVPLVLKQVVLHFFYGNYINLNEVPCLYSFITITPMDIECLHIGANCNPMPNTLQFLDDEHILFCFSNQVALYSLPLNTILLNLSLPGLDPNRANCLYCISPTVAAVGYDSGHIALFQNTASLQWEVKQVIKQEGAITFIHFNDGLVITGNTCAEIQLYHYEDVVLNQLETLKFPLNKTIESVTSCQYNDSTIIFLGGIDQKVHCYTKKGKENCQYRFGLSGHENSITKVTVTLEDGDLLLASASKDGYIRLWRLTHNLELRKFHKNVKEMDGLICFLDAVLISHQCSVTDLTWVHIRKKLELVSCSLDCTVCIWGKEQEGAWSVDARMGQFLGNKNSYFNIEVSPSGSHLVAVNYIGSTMIWKYDQEAQKFNLLPSFNGHYMEVRGIQWNHTGDFLVSVSKDQTTRIISRNKQDKQFHEISRAQIHGYDINAVETIKIKDGVIDVIACGADEKVVRIVEPPACFANYLNYSTHSNFHLFFPSQEEQDKYLTKKAKETGCVEYQAYAEGGIQVLGLMTKMQKIQREKITSYYEDEEEEAVEEQEKAEGPGQTKIDYTIPPNDDYLVKHTLWPEMNKLYGHPHEISALAKCNSRSLLVSSCSGLNKTSCKMIVWDVNGWKIKKVIQYHSYTVFGMDFSPCGQYFASVSKDRKLGVFNSEFELQFGYEAHTRAITCVAFSPCGKFLATGSRQKLIKVHSMEKKSPVAELAFKKPITAITYCDESLLAVGCQDGTITFVTFSDEKLEMREDVGSKYGHTKAVNGLVFKNGMLASCGDDHSVRVFWVGLQK